MKSYIAYIISVASIVALCAGAPLVLATDQQAVDQEVAYMSDLEAERLLLTNQIARVSQASSNYTDTVNLTVPSTVEAILKTREQKWVFTLLDGTQVTNVVLLGVADE